MPKKKDEPTEIVAEEKETEGEPEAEIGEAPLEEGLDEAVKMTSDVPVHVVAVLGKKTVSMRELVSLHMGSTIDLARPPNEVVDLVANGRLIAKGELVDIDGKLGVRIVKMMRASS